MSELKLVFLGTGSARPTPMRGVSGIYLQYEGSSILFDCGEGTQLQLTRAGVKASRLEAICISHFHGDHINGLPGFLGTMGLNGHETPITLAGPPGMDKYLRTLAELSICKPRFPVKLVSNEETLVMKTKDFELTTCPLRHRIPTWGFKFREFDLPGRFNLEAAKSLGVPPGPLFGKLQRGESVTLEDGRIVQPSDVLGETRKGRTVAYISDTRPSPKVVEFVQGVDLLIHEATYMHDLRKDASKRGHSTTIEAARVARDAGVKQLVLNHFSSKYMRTGPLVREAKSVFENTVAASDLSEFIIDIPA